MDEGEKERKKFSSSEIEEYDGSFDCVIPNFSEVREHTKFATETFTIHGCKWRLLIFPGHPPECVGVYINVAEDNLPLGWHRFAKFSLGIRNTSGEHVHTTAASHNFLKRESDWGFSAHFKLRDFCDPSKGYLNDDTLTIVVRTKVIRDYLDFSSLPLSINHNPKTSLGFIGLENHGAQDRLGVLVQLYYHLTFIRASLAQISSDDLNILQELQSLFYRLQQSCNPVSLKHFMSLLQLDDYETFMKRSVFDLNRLFLDLFHRRVEGTVLEGIGSYFCGELLSHIDSSSTPFLSLDLDPEGCGSIYDSLNRFLAPKGKSPRETPSLLTSSFSHLPDVLEINLQRFRPSISAGMRKIVDRCEFFSELDLTSYLHESAKEKGQSIYRLFAVISHSGTPSTGHYSAFIRPSCGVDWLLFDDEKIRKVSEKEAIQDNFGSPEEGKFAPDEYACLYKLHKNYSNAVMLIYIREEALGTVFPESPPDPPAEVSRVIQAEILNSEKKKYEKENEFLSLSVCLVTEEDLEAHDQEKFGLVDFSDIQKRKVKKSSSLESIKKFHTNEKQIEPERIRFWNWAVRKNKTIRTEKPTPDYELVREIGKLERNPTEDFRFFLEDITEDALYFHPFDSVMIFLKFYEAETGAMRYIGRQYYRKRDYLRAIFGSFEEEEEDLLVYEEITPSIIELKDPRKTFEEEGIGSGDILILERAAPHEERQKFPHYNCAKWYEAVERKVTVCFRNYGNPKEEFSLSMLKSFSFDDTLKVLYEARGWKKGSVTLWKDQSKSVLSLCQSSSYPTLQTLLRYTNPQNTLFYELQE